MANESSHAGGRPPRASARELDLFDLAAFVWTQKFLAVLVAILVFIVLAFLVWSALTPTYQAQSRLLIILDDNDLTPGAAGSGGAFTLDQVMESEAEILNSDAVRRRALEARSPMVDPAQITAMRQGFSLSRAPNASVLVASFEDPDADVAANTLNALIDAYLEYRVELLVGAPGEGVEERLAAAETEAARAQAELRSLLNENDLVDFEGEREALLDRIADLQSRQLAARAEASSGRAAADALAQRLSNIPQSIELYVENSATGELLSLELRRQELLAGHLPNSPQVIAIEREIAALNAFIDNGGAEGRGQRRTGVNPVWQALESERLQQEAFAASQSQLAAALSRQLADAREEADRLRVLAPAHDRLARAASARSEAAQRLSIQAADASARRNAPAGAADAVRVVERASPPIEANSLRAPAMLAVAFFALAVGLFVALLRGYWVSRPSDAAPSPDPTPQPRRTSDAMSDARSAASAGVQTQARRSGSRSKPLSVLAHVRGRGASAAR